MPDYSISIDENTTIDIDIDFLINIRHKDLSEVKSNLDMVQNVLENFNVLKNDTDDVPLLKEYYEILNDAYKIQNNDIFQRYKGEIKNFYYNDYNRRPNSQDVINYLENNDVRFVNNLILWGNVRTDAFDAIYNHETLGTNTLVERDKDINYFCIVVFMEPELFMTFMHTTHTTYKWIRDTYDIIKSYSSGYTVKKHDKPKRGMIIDEICYEDCDDEDCDCKCAKECDVHETRYKIYTLF